MASGSAGKSRGATKGKKVTTKAGNVKRSAAKKAAPKKGGKKR